jgi:preprotein translocase subunit SecD
VNRYPKWGYALIVLTILVAALYTVPNFYGEAPAVQVSTGKATVKLDRALLDRVEETLKKNAIPYDRVQFDASGVKVRFPDPDTQLRARDALNAALNPTPDSGDYTVALNLLPASPNWLTTFFRATPMTLGLDLRGGVYFLLQVNMDEAVKKRLENYTGEIRQLLRDKGIRYSGVTRDGQTLRVRFADGDMRDKARLAMLDNMPDLAVVDRNEGQTPFLLASIKPAALKRIEEAALKQNIGTLGNRVNGLGVSEPVIQQQGEDRIAVQLPGVQDPVRAREILGRTATLEVRMVDEEATASGSKLGVDVFPERLRDGRIANVAVKKQAVITGDQFINAAATFDQDQRPAVSVDLDQAGGRVMRQVTRENLHRRMAIVLFEKGKGEAISVATIQGEFGSRFQITGAFTPAETTDLALLIRSGSLAAPMEIIEERTIGPSLGKDNITRGFDATMWGFVAIVVFMSLYYALFGLISSVALGVNLLLLVGGLSMLPTTLTLPGIAAIALTLGMAIDANVLINERIREELRAGATPQAAIAAGYERAWATIFDSNVTTLIVGASLLIVPGAVRGFAVVHCLGILTSMFSSVIVSRAAVNLTYGHRRRVARLAIGNTKWK